MDGLGLRGLRLVAVHEPDPSAKSKSDQKRRFEVEPTLNPSHCPSCGSLSLYRHGTRQQKYADVPFHGEPAVLLVKRRRWRCNDCKGVFPDRLVDMDEKRHATRRLVEYVGKRSMEFTFEAVARDVGISGPAVKDMFNDQIEAFQRKYRFITPTVLGIDELHLLGEYRCILTNIEARTIYDILPSRKIDVLRRYFPGMHDRQNVRFVTADFYKPYAVVAHDYFPGARLVIDRFHVQRMGSNGVEAFRKHYRKTLSKKERISLKNDKSVVLTHAGNLQDWQHSRLQDVMDDHPMMGWAWAVKEMFHNIWKAEDREEAEKRIDTWLLSVPDELVPFFKEPISVFNTRRDEILNYFDCGVTNGLTECMNGLTKTANRIGRGYSFEAIRAKMLYNRKAIEKGAVVKRVASTRQPKDDGGMVTLSTASSMHARGVATRYQKRWVFRGAHIPTLASLAETDRL